MFMVMKHTLKEDSRRKVANALVTEDLGSHVLLTDVKHLWKGFQRYTTTLMLLACISMRMNVKNMRSKG